jgi:hypothetical protein
VQVTQGDWAENLGEAHATFVVLTDSPTVVIGPIRPDSNDATPTFAGTAGTGPFDEAHVTLKIYKEGAALGTPAEVPLSGGAWSYLAPKLTNGHYTISVSQRDQAGNVGETSSPKFTIDTTPPKVTITSPVNGQTIGSAQPTFKGVAGDEEGDEQLVTLSIYTAAKGHPEKLVETRTVTLKPGEHEWLVGPIVPALAAGEYVAVASQADEAGNIGEQAVAFTVATNGPLVTLESPGLVDRGASTPVSGPTPSFRGLAGSQSEDEETISVKIYETKTDQVARATAPANGRSGRSRHSRKAPMKSRPSRKRIWANPATASRSPSRSTPPRRRSRSPPPARGPSCPETPRRLREAVGPHPGMTRA